MVHEASAHSGRGGRGRCVGHGPDHRRAGAQNVFEPGNRCAGSHRHKQGLPTSQRGNIRQGMLESSNVNVVEELVEMIEAQRAYEINSKMVSAVDEMLRNANQTL